MKNCPYSPTLKIKGARQYKLTEILTMVFHLTMQSITRTKFPFVMSSIVVSLFSHTHLQPVYSLNSYFTVEESVKTGLISCRNPVGQRTERSIFISIQINQLQLHNRPTRDSCESQNLTLNQRYQATNETVPTFPLM